MLPHHGLLALAFPDLLAGYDAAYSAMALADRVLSHHNREFVWLAVLAATDEALATHPYRQAAGGEETIADACVRAGVPLPLELHETFVSCAVGRSVVISGSVNPSNTLQGPGVCCAVSVMAEISFRSGG